MVTLGLPCLNRADDIGVNDTFAELGFSVEASDGGLFLPELIAQHLEGHLAILRVLGAIDDGRAALPDEALQRVAGD